MVEATHLAFVLGLWTGDGEEVDGVASQGPTQDALPTYTRFEGVVLWASKKKKVFYNTPLLRFSNVVCF